MSLDPLQVTCPHCHAKPGEKCKNYKGKGCDHHRDRKKAARPQDEHWRQAELKTKRELAKQIDQAPLFEEQTRAEARTVDENYWRTRFAVAGMQENAEPFVGFHDKWKLHLMRRLAKDRLGVDVFAKLDEKLTRTYPLSYQPMIWKEILTSTMRRVVLAYNRLLFHGPFLVTIGDVQELWTEKIRVEEAEVWPPDDYVPPCTEAQVAELLAIPEPVDFPSAVDPLRLAQ